MHHSVAELKENIHKYGYKVVLFRFLYDIIYNVPVYLRAVLLASFKTLVLKNMFLGDYFVAITSSATLRETSTIWATLSSNWTKTLQLFPLLKS